MTANRVLIRAGFLLFLLTLVLGLVISQFLNPKMALGTHVTGFLNALVLIALGLAWDLLELTPAREKLTARLFLYSAYASLIGGCLAAAWGTSKITPLAGAGHSAAAWQETVVLSIQLTVALTILGGTVLVIYGLRPRARA